MTNHQILVMLLKANHENLVLKILKNRTLLKLMKWLYAFKCLDANISQTNEFIAKAQHAMPLIIAIVLLCLRYVVGIQRLFAVLRIKIYVRVY